MHLTRRLLWFLFGTAAILAGVAPVPSYASEPGHTTPATETPPEAGVSGITPRHQIDELRADWGVSESEAQERLARQAVATDLHASIRATERSTFGGMWIDHADGGRIKIATTEPGSFRDIPIPEALRGLVDEIVVERSYQSLQSLLRSAVAAQKPGIQLADYTVDVQTNRVVVYVHPGRHQASERDEFLAVIGQLRKADPTAFEVREVAEASGEDTCTIPSCPAPLRGGLGLTAAGASCTLGFMTQSTAGIYYALTAGHCPDATYLHNGTLVGSTVQRVAEGNVDAQKMSVSPVVWSPQNRVYSGGDSYLAITSTVVTYAILEGTYLCRTGARTGTRCGDVTDTAWHDGHGFYPLIAVDACADDGDSGGPWVDASANRAYGLHRGSTSEIEPCPEGETSYFSPIRDVEAALNAYVLIAPGRTSRPGVHPSNSFYQRETLTAGAVERSFSFGNPGDIALFCDWNGNRTKTVGVYRPSTGTFYLRNDNSGGTPDAQFTYGNPYDQPICGDWNGDGIETVGVFRSGWFHLRNSHSSGIANISSQFGNPTDFGVAGDWDGNGVDSIGVTRATGTDRWWYLSNSNSSPSVYRDLGFGAAVDPPLVGNWDGNSTDSVGVVHASGGAWVWHLRNTLSTGPGEVTGFSYGATSDPAFSYV
jgi:hypothetical protein